MENRNVKHGFWQSLRRAFTITELVIVIAVVAVLAAVLIPTFSNVIGNSKKSHDEQFVKEINVALNAYTVENGAAPSDYEELMLALADAGLCDSANPFLLGTELKQENKTLIWYRNANSVVLLDTSESSDYVITYTDSIGHGNGVYVFNKTGAGGTEAGFMLCTVGSPDGPFIAGLYRDIYITSGGDIGDFMTMFGEKYSADNILGQVHDQAWGNNIIGSLVNQKQGYTFSKAVAEDIKEQAAASETINLNISAPAPGATEEQIVGAQQQVRSALATLAQFANNTTDAETLEGKKVTLAGAGAAADALSTVTVSMSDVNMTTIGTTYRKDYEKNTVERSSFSVDFGGLTIADVAIAENELVSAGAEYQTAADCGRNDPAYMFTYGLFGTINAEVGETVTISNLTIDDVDMNLMGASELIGGTKVHTLSDMAGIVAGYTQGNVVFENITITGADGSASTENADALKPDEKARGGFHGFDGVAAIVGRAYGNQAGAPEKVVIRDCHISDINIFGERRAAGFVGYAGRDIQVEITDSSITNMVVVDRRSDGNAGMYSGVIGHTAKGSKVTVDNVTLNNVRSVVQYRADASAEWFDITEYNYPTTNNTSKTLFIQPDPNNTDTYVILQYAEDEGLLVIAGDGLVVNGKRYAAGTSFTRGVAITGGTAVQAEV